MGCQLNTSHLQYKLYLLHTVGSALTRDYERKVDARYRVIFQPDPTSLTSLPSLAYRCQNCRSPLISEDALIPHYPNETPDWTDGRWSGRMETDSNSNSSRKGSGRLEKGSNSSSSRMPPPAPAATGSQVTETGVGSRLIQHGALTKGHDEEGFIKGNAE
ncbi:hypothetical protein Pcinc_030410 [Petrolisthes cinctipes]|uniref:Uncharacterized protein n=1 Tax=Petrolisthes cinctipes TaxID=88211 RepID=A0AAE1K4A6_PETCI|nr:hypothetical protein Pcinc_030410 [Petrolisthes cinctipes]